MTQVLAWIRGNVAVVVSGVVIVAALVLAPWLSGGWSDGVRRTAEERARRASELSSFERTEVVLEIPGQAPRSESGVVNAALLAEYQRVSGQLREDAQRVRERAVSHNRKGRGVVVEGAFPRTDASRRETIQFEVHRALVQAYARLLESVRAGSPPAPDQLGEELQRREFQFIASSLRKRTRGDLDASELKDLEAELVKARLVRCGERARELSFYASPEALRIPAAPEQTRISPATLFDWQWRFWMAEDLLEALAAANRDFPSVVEAPVKRLVQLSVVSPMPGSSRSEAGGGGGGGGGGGAMPGMAMPGGFGGRGGFGGGGGDPFGDATAGGGAAAESFGELGPVTVDASAEAALDFANTFTGRVSNSIYDVRLLEAVVVVSTEQMPRLFDAIAQRNFMTVLDLRVRPADAFAAARQGFIYGPEPVSEVTILIETIWLREWTADFMPGEVRAALGIGGPGAGGDGMGE